MRILVVDDDKHLASLTAQALRVEGYVVDIEHDGVSGAKAATEHDYDLITMDWNMPHKEGPETTKQLRDNGVNTPILMITARTETADKITGLNNGVDDYITKPFDIEELLARVRALLRRPQATQAILLTVGDLTVNTTDHSVERNGIQIELTKKEYALLEYLMRNINTPQSREALLSHVWGMKEGHTSNRIDAYVKNLRKKVDTPFDKQLIHTVRGVGYKISVD